jgi:hypothetical protein
MHSSGTPGFRVIRDAILAAPSGQRAGGPALTRASSSSAEPRVPKMASSHQVAPAWA